MSFHPTALLLVWIGFALSLQWAGISIVLAAAVLSLAAALYIAPARCRNLLYRSRWLLLSLALLFVFFTPGEYLDGMAGSIGVTREGLRFCAEHLGRLLALLASLALLHEYLGTQGLLAGLYMLMAWSPWREATVVRLMLVLEYVERRPPDNWRVWLADEAAVDGEEAVLRLSRQEFHTRDLALIVTLGVGFILVALV